MTDGNSVATHLFRQPFTWLACVVVVGLDVAFIKWFQPPMMVLGAALGLGLICLLLWPLLYLRSADFLQQLYEAPDHFVQAQQVRIEALAEDFLELGLGQGNAQLGLLQDKFSNLAEVLKRRLQTTDVPYQSLIKTWLAEKLDAG